LEETHIFSSHLTNSVRLGVNRELANNDQSVKAINALSGDPTLGAVPGRDASLVLISGIDDMPGGLGALSTWFFRWNFYASIRRCVPDQGIAFSEFGVGFERMRLNQETLTNTGTFKFW